MGLLRGEQTKIILKKCKKQTVLGASRRQAGLAPRIMLWLGLVSCYCCEAAAAASTHFLTSSTTGTL